MEYHVELSRVKWSNGRVMLSHVESSTVMVE